MQIRSDELSRAGGAGCSVACGGGRDESVEVGPFVEMAEVEV